VKFHFAVEDAQALVVARAVDLVEEPSAKHHEDLKDAVVPMLALMHWQMANNKLSLSQIELMLFIQQIRAELNGALATLELAVMTPGVSEQECVAMADMLEHGVELFINASEGNI
jgi:hypothetical protein